MDWLTAAFIAMSISAAVTVADKYVVGYFSPRLYSFFIGLVGLLSILFMPFTQSLSLIQWFYGIALGIVFACFIYAGFNAYQKDEISRFASLTILSGIIIAIGGAIFYDERLTQHQFFAFGLFIIGSLLLATRIETRVVIEGKGNFKQEELPSLARLSIKNPLGASVRAGKQIANKVDKVVANWVSAAKNPQVTWIRLSQKLKLIDGLGWYIFSLVLYVPYALLSKDLSNSTGPLAGWISIRVGLFIGGIILMTNHWSELKQLKKQKKITLVASIKEIFGMLANYMILFSATTGSVGIVQALWAVEAVFVFIISITLAKFGIIEESLKRGDLIQKTAGVFIVACATILLFM